MSELIHTPRNPDTIAAVINGIKEQVRVSVVSGAVEIGRRLKEAKSIVPRGQWTEWLNANVDYSDRTAQNMMRIAEEYGLQKESALTDLSYTQAVLLLGVPQEEREAFIADHDLESMSTRELQDAVRSLKEQNASMQQTLDNQAAGFDARPDPLPDDVSEATDEPTEEVTRLMAELEEACAALAKEQQQKDGLKQGQQKAEARVAKLELELATAKTALENAKKEATVPPEVDEELQRLRAQANRSTNETLLRATYDTLKDSFGRLVNQLAAMEQAGDGDAHLAPKYRVAFSKGLQTMAARLEAAP